MADFATHTITLDDFLTADEHTSTRGRKKGSSKIEKDFGAWLTDNPTAPVWQFRGKDYAGLRRAVVRSNGSDSSKIEDYESALESLGLLAKVVAREGSGNEQVVTVMIARADMIGATDTDSDEV